MKLTRIPAIAATILAAAPALAQEAAEAAVAATARTPMENAAIASNNVVPCGFSVFIRR